MDERPFIQDIINPKTNHNRQLMGSLVGSLQRGLLFANTVSKELQVLNSIVACLNDSKERPFHCLFAVAKH
jgi:hypothetical protein